MRTAIVERFTRVYTAPESLAEAWPQAKRMIVLERYGEREGHIFNNISYYLSDLDLGSQGSCH